MKLSDLFESKNMIGMKMHGKKITTEWKDDFSCQSNQLTSLEGCPTSVGGKFSCWRNQITSLEGCPTTVGSSFSCEDNRISSLKDIHKQVKEIHGRFNASQNPIKSHVLGLLLIKGCTKVELMSNNPETKKVQDILNKYLPNDRGHRGLAECQDELIEAGLEEFAQI
jgi:hypothetical protein